ncbi:hypothetical protein NBRC116597_02700 [Phaeobacter sp. NW0010-22]
MPAIIAVSMPKRMIGMPIPKLGSAAFITKIISPAIKAAIDPTDKSKPPAVITKVMPTAMIPIKAERARTLVILAALRKLEFNIAPMINKTTKAIMGPSTDIDGRRMPPD